MFLRVRAAGTPFDLVDPDSSILRDALPRQGYEPALCTLLADSLEAGRGPFLDVGALYGFFSVWAALRGVPVVAFEPRPEYADLLELNLRLNGCEARVERAALSDREGRVDHRGRTAAAPALQARRPYARGVLNQLARRDRGGRVVHAHADDWTAPVGQWIAAAAAGRLGLFRSGGDGRARAVPTIRLDDWVGTTGIMPGIAKIDVHGAEVGVLRGMPCTLREHLQTLLVEVHTPDLLITGTHDELLGLLEDAGFDVYELRGFRRSRGRLVPLTGGHRSRFCDVRRWTAEDLYFMRAVYATRRGDGDTAAGETKV